MATEKQITIPQGVFIFEFISETKPGDSLITLLIGLWYDSIEKLFILGTLLLVSLPRTYLND
jgi:hypothetical protein